MTKERRDLIVQIYLVGFCERKWKALSHVRLFATPWTIQSCTSPGQNTGVGSLSLLQGIFPTQGLNSGLLHCRQILHQPSHQGSPRVLEWVAYPFSSRSSWPRNQAGVSCIAGRFFTSWATREALRLVCSWIQADPWTTWVWTVQVHLHKSFLFVFFSVVNTTVLHYLAWLNSWMKNHKHGQTADTEVSPSYTQIFDGHPLLQIGQRSTEWFFP